MVQVTYQKQDGCIMQKLRKTMLPYKVGETTSMGWKVLDIEYKYTDKYYSEYRYNMLIHKDKQNLIKKKQTIGLFMRELRTFFYYLIALMVISFLRALLGI